MPFFVFHPSPFSIPVFFLFSIPPFFCLCILASHFPFYSFVFPPLFSAPAVFFPISLRVSSSKRVTCGVLPVCSRDRRCLRYLHCIVTMTIDTARIAEQGLCNGRASVCVRLSVCPVMFSRRRPLLLRVCCCAPGAGRRYQSPPAARRRKLNIELKTSEENGQKGTGLFWRNQ